MSAPPMLVIELAIESPAIAMLDHCYSEADERRVLIDLAQRDLANPGDSLTFTFTNTLNHLFAEPFNGPVGFDLGYTPGTVFFTPGGTTFTLTCTVTATET